MSLARSMAAPNSTPDRSWNENSLSSRPTTAPDATHDADVLAGSYRCTVVVTYAPRSAPHAVKVTYKRR